MNHISSFFSPKIRKSTASTSSAASSASPSSHRDGSSRREPAPRLERINASRYIDYIPEDQSTRSSVADGVSSFRLNGFGDWEVSSLYDIIGISGPEDFAVDLETWKRSRTSPHHYSSPLVPAVKADEEATRDGIKGTRPPMLASPSPYVSDVAYPTAEAPERSCWDLVNPLGSHGVRPCGDATASCSFTTMNDDDCSSTTTEGFSMSPMNGRCIRWQIGSWSKGRELGRGSFGTVYEAIAEDGGFFAVKEVSLLNQLVDSRQSIDQLEQEILLLSQFEHENIVRYLGTEKNEDKFYIFLELITQGSLVSLYNKYRLQDSQVSAYTWQILNGLQYLHERNVVHRDIKCANLLVDVSGSAKLADFGLAKRASKVDGLKSCRGSIYWMAPEVVKPQTTRGYGSPADIWSLGCTVLEMLTRKPPYVSEHTSSEANWVKVFYSIGGGVKPDIPAHISDNARDFISQCIQVNPEDRPTATELLDHPFVKRQSCTYTCPRSPFYR